MAWNAYLVEMLPEGTTQHRVIIAYFDDADPANAGVGPGPPLKPPTNILYTASFALPAGQTLASLRSKIDAEGQAARDLAGQRAQILGQFPIGSTRLVP